MDAKSLLFLIGLKEIRRTGWVRSKIPYPESVAAHSWGAAALAYALAPKYKGVNREKLVLMSVFHDIGEAATGIDSVADRGRRVNWKGRKAKAERELEALSGKVSAKILSIFREMEAGRTKTACAAKEIEKLDMALTAFAYEHRTGKNLQEFYDSADVWIRNRHLRKIFLDLLEMRKSPKKKQKPFSIRP